MAGNTRGRLKERFEGIHRNLDWAEEHCKQSLILIADKNPNLTTAIKALHEGLEKFDELTQSIYAKL